MNTLQEKIINIPGSKSYTNRALFVAALTKGKVKIKNALISDDTNAMLACLRALGVIIIRKGNTLQVINQKGFVRNNNYKLDARLSGTTIRFMLALTTVIPGQKILRGKAGLNKRPIGDLVDGLRQLGAKITYLGKEGYPPLRIESSKLLKNTVKMSGSISSQYVSALLMIAPLIGGINIKLIGEQISKPYIDMTIDLMEKFGVTVKNDAYQKYSVGKNEKYSGENYPVEGDFSSAAYFFALAALTKATLTLTNLNPKSMQADLKFLAILAKMGNKINYHADQITFSGNGVKAVTVDMENCPDQAQTLAVLAAFAKGTTKITGIRSLRVKETERIIAVQKELEKMGIKTVATHDSLTIYGGNPKPVQIDTHGDHRMAMAFAVAAAKLPEMVITDPDVVNKTFPEFWKELAKIGIKVKTARKTNIVLIGMRGSGKTTVGKLLSERASKNFLDLDRELEKKLAMKVSDIVEKYGWDYFREQEALIAQQLTTENTVIATGGGVILREENMAALKTNGLVVFLNADLKVLKLRIGDGKKRPAFNKGAAVKDELKKVLQERESLYKNYADIIVRTDTKKKADVVEEIYAKVKGKV